MLPWSDGRENIDHAAYQGGRSEHSYAGNLGAITGKRVAWTFRRDAGTSDIWLNGIHKKLLLD